MKKINVLILLIGFIFSQKVFAGSVAFSCLPGNFKRTVCVGSSETVKFQVNTINSLFFSGDSIINCDDLQDDKSKSKTTHDLFISFAFRFQSDENGRAAYSILHPTISSGKLFILNSVFRL